MKKKMPIPRYGKVRNVGSGNIPVVIEADLTPVGLAHTCLVRVRALIGHNAASHLRDDAVASVLSLAVRAIPVVEIGDTARSPLHAV